jgi:uncharacterized protein with ParB-like and HNH nuclease domain
MEVILVTLSQLFANNLEQFKVPAYQRRYSWNTDQIEELFNDIVSQNDHLLGMLILFRVNINIYDIVDGQQRLTSISIIYNELSRIYERKGMNNIANLLKSHILCFDAQGQSTSKLKLGNMDNQDYSNLMDNQINIINDNFRDVTNWIRNKLTSFDQNNQLDIFRDKFLHRTKIIKVLDNNRNDVNNFFETLNNRGKPLTKTDIIKNYIFWKAFIHNGALTEDIIDIWTEIIQTLDPIAKEDVFFRRFLSSIECDSIKENEIVARFKIYFERKLQQHVTIASILEEIKSSAIIYIQIAFSRYPDPDVNQKLKILNAIKGENTYSFLMQFLKKQIPVDNKIDIIHRVTSIMLRRHICGRQTGGNEQIIVRLNRHLALLDNNDFTQFRINVNHDLQLGNNYPNDEEFKGFLINYRVNKPVHRTRAQIFLNLFNNSIQGNTFIGDYEEFELFHIIDPTSFNDNLQPQGGIGNQWIDYLNNGVRTPDIIVRRYTLGNITLKHPNDNLIFIGNGNIYENLRIGLGQSQLALNVDLFNNCVDFNGTQMEDRTKRISDVVVKYFRI